MQGSDFGVLDVRRLVQRDAELVGHVPPDGQGPADSKVLSIDHRFLLVTSASSPGAPKRVPGICVIIDNSNLPEAIERGAGEARYFIFEHVRPEGDSDMSSSTAVPGHRLERNSRSSAILQHPL